MKSIKKIIMSVAAVVLTLLIGGNVHASTTNSKEYTPKKLVIAFDPSSNAETMESKAQPFGKLLSKQLGIPVKVVVATNDDTMIEGMGSGKVDCAFLPPEGYVLAHQKYGVKVILQSTRYAYKEPDDQMTHHLVKDFHAQILVQKSSGIKSLKDLRGKKIAVQSSTSTAGWIWPVVALYKHGINIYKDNIQTVQVKGHDQGVMAVYNGSADACFVFQGARNIVKKDAPDVMQKVVPLYTTPAIPDDTVSVRGNMSPAFQKKLINAFQTVAKSKQGHKIIQEVYQQQGYVKANNSDFNKVREYAKIMQKINQSK